MLRAPQLIDVERYTSGAYGDLFRRGSDTSDLELTDDRRPTTDDRPPTVVSNLQSRRRSPLSRSVNSCCFAATGSTAGAIERLRVEVVGEVTMICAASLADARIVQDQLLGVIRLTIAELGGPTVIRLAARRL